MRPHSRFGICSALLVLVVACADVPSHTSELLAGTRSGSAVYTLGAAVEGRPVSGSTRKIRAGTTWTDFGAIGEGTVFRPRDTVLTAEGIHVREAYVVVRDGTWVGLWLPYEKAFVPLATAVPITMRKE